MLPTFDAANKVWRGSHRPVLYNPNASIGQIMLSVLQRGGQSVLQYDGDTGGVMTNAEMRLRAVRIVQNLHNRGFKQGDMVTVACVNSENLAPLVIALMTAGMPFNALAPSYEVDDMAHMMAITQPKLVFCDASNRSIASEAAKRAVREQPQIFVVESDREGVSRLEDLLQETGSEHFYVAPYLGDSNKLTAFLVCTSGTTGLPKAVFLSHAQLIMATNEYKTITTRLRFSFSPIFWISGLTLLLQSIMTGIPRLITRQKCCPDSFFKLLESYRFDWFLTPPSYAKQIVDDPRAKTADFSSIRYFLTGGSFVSNLLRQQLEAMLPNGKTYVGMGNSETAMICLMEMASCKLGSVGHLTANIEARVIDDNGDNVCPGIKGELVVRCPFPLLGYFNNPEATESAIDDDGWFYTGDVGYFDEQGFFFMVDRKKELLKYMNYQIAPPELEALIERIPGIQQAWVFGLPHEEDCASDLVTAAVVKKENCTLSEQDILEIVHRQVPDYKRLRGGVHVLSELPLTNSGKLLKRRVRDIVAKRLNVSNV